RSPDLLVGQRGEAPETRRMDVELVDGTRDQREQQAEGAGEHERGEQVDRAVAAGQPVRLVLKRRPPEEEAGHEVARVLDVDQARRMPECRVVGSRDVPGEVRADPEWE